MDTATVGAVLKGTYTYNGLEQLAIRVTTNMTPSGTTHFVHDLQGNVIAEADGAAAVATTVREYLYLPEAEIAPTFGSRAQVDRPIAVVNAVNTAPTLWFVHVDHLNRPIKLTTSTKASVWDAVWQPWGGTHTITGTAVLDARFPGQWFQLETGLHYNWHRSYDPSVGRYTQADPMEFVDGPSLYGYADGNPQNFVDPEGLWIPQAIYYCVRFGGPIGIAAGRAAIKWLANKPSQSRGLTQGGRSYQSHLDRGQHPWPPPQSRTPSGMNSSSNRAIDEIVSPGCNCNMSPGGTVRIRDVAQRGLEISKDGRFKGFLDPKVVFRP